MARTLADLEREVAELTARIERGTYYRKHAQEHRAGGRDVMPAGGGTALTVREVDGVPSVANVDTIEVSNGTLTDLGGGDVRIATGGGGSALTVQELDGTPSDTAVTIIRVTNNGLTDNGAGDVTLEYVSRLLGDAKGDLIVFTAADTPARVAVGVNGTMPMADSVQTAGLKYTNPALLAWVLGV